MDLDFNKIQKIVGTPKIEIEKKYMEWEKNKTKSGKSTEVVDLKLLAALSGLSPSSVSNYFNNKKGAISKEKIDLLEKLTDLIGYTPSKAAKKLRSSRKMSIGFVFSVTSGTSMEYYIEVLRGVKKEANKYGYFVDIYDIEEEKRKHFFSELPFLGLIDGLIIVASVVTSEQLTPLIERNIPVVLINPKIKESRPPVTAGIYSDPAVFSQLLDHLFSIHGYRNPVLISVDIDNSFQRQEKLDIFQEKTNEYGIDFDKEKHVVFISSHSFPEGMKAYDIANKINPDADVYVCLTDTLAVPIIRRLQEDNKKAAVTGYANFEIAQVFNLTTVEQNIQIHGAKAFQNLFYSIQYIQRNNKFPEYNSEYISGDFIIQKSCGCKDS